MRRATVAALACLVAVVAGGTSIAWAGATATPHVFNVRDYGAAGDGVTNDTPAVNAAIVAASATGSGVVRFPAGTYLAGGSIHLLSNVTLQVDTGATVLGDYTGYDAPEPNPNDAYQDFGHSHFHDAMIWGDNLKNIGFTGGGVIDGGGRLALDAVTPGQADKIISLTRCDGLTVGGGLTLRRGGHFAMLTNDCVNVTSDHLTIDTATDRDGWDVISTRNVAITNITVSSNDDALAFKSDWALGATLPSGNVSVTNAHLSAVCCNALMFGSETCGDFTNYHFTNITITGAGKSGLGMVSMDGAHISHVFYTNVTMSNTDTPLTEKIGTRRRCGNSPGVGSISDIHYSNVTGTHAGVFTPTLWGQPGHPISDVTFDDVDLTLPGGRPAMDPNQLPTDTGDYNPRSLGIRPSYGFYVHNAQRVRFTDSALRLAADDGRPAFIANTAGDITLDHVTVQRGSTSPFDLGFQSVSGYCLVSTPGRISVPVSTASCGKPTDFALSPSPASGTVTAGSSVSFTIHTKATSGRPDAIRLAASGVRPGTTVAFSPASVQPGKDATMTVRTTASARNGTYPLTVVGSDTYATEYATVGLTVTGGVSLAITNLSVADPANAAAWSVQPSLQAGVPVNGDRTVLWTGIPAVWQGAPWIRTANASTTATASPLATFTINAGATVGLAVDTRVGQRPWMDASWVDTGAQLVDLEGTTYRYFEVFEKTFPAGTVALGPEADTANLGSMYTVAIR
jgi:hypothetical protein